MATPAAPSGGPIVSLFHPADTKASRRRPSYGRNSAVAAASLAALALLAGCSKKQAPQAASLPQVGVITVHTQPVTRITDLPGRTNAVLTSDIRPQVSGVILKRLFVEGSDVTAVNRSTRSTPRPIRRVMTVPWRP